MTLPFISVIIPVYNEEKHLEECLRAVFSVDYPRDRYEVIAVNNNSTDHSRELISTFPSVTLIDESDQGYVPAIIAGTNAAKGEIFAYTDADSVVPPQWLSRVARAYNDPAVSAVGGSMRYKNRTILSCLSIIGFYPRFLLLKLMTGPNMTIRKSAYLECGGFSRQVGFIEDAYISYRLRKFGKVIILMDNPVITSDRRLRRIDRDTVDYNVKSFIFITLLVVFGKTIPFTNKHIE